MGYDAPMTDTSTDLTTMNAEDTIAHLRANPAQVDAVREAETARDNPRKSVLAAIRDAEGTYDPVDEYPERPTADALTDQAKKELAAQGYAEGEGAEWHLTNPAVVPGSVVYDRSPDASPGQAS